MGIETDLQLYKALGLGTQGEKRKEKKKNLSWDRWFVIYFYIQNETGDGDVLQERTKTQSKNDMQGRCSLGFGLELRRHGMT